MKIPNLLLSVTLSLFASSVSFAEDKPGNADNTSRNKEDKTGATATPFDQSNAPEDIKLVAAIRKAVIQDGNLSATAKNCKIITSTGRVILRGPVNSAEEKAAIEAHAVAATAKDKVHNLLEIKAAK